MKAPGEPDGPPEISSTDVTGTFAVILIEPGLPLSAGIEIPVAL